MPPVRKFNKEDIVETAFRIVAEEGIESLNARRIAKELGSSVQPIFHNFASMSVLEEAVHRKIYDKYKEYLMNGSEEPDGYRRMGLGYIKFARDYPNLFKILFMQKTKHDLEGFIKDDALNDDIIKIGQKLTGFSFEEQKRFHVKVWLFTHGVACLSATSTVAFSDEELIELLTSTVREMATGLKVKKEKEENGKDYRN